MKFLNDIGRFADLRITDDIKLRFKLALLDYIGVTLAGVKENTTKLESMIDKAEKGSAPVIGLDHTISLENAVFYNGLNGHALDFDDGTNTGIIHLGSPVFSVLIPLAAIHDVSFDRFMRAAIVGYESAFTMAVSIQPQHKQRGFHACGTCGTLGVALAVAYLLGLTPKQRRDAFSAAAVSASGTLKVIEDESSLKPFNVGKAALLGLIASKMGIAGFNGPDDVLAGSRGFLSMMYGSETVELMPTLLGGTRALEKAYIKPYAACRYCHPSIEAAILIRNRHEFLIDEIESVRVTTYSLAVFKHDHQEVFTIGSAKMSIPFSVAVAFVSGKAGLWEFTDEAIMNSDTLKLAKKVSVFPSDELNAVFPEKQTAIVEVHTKDGRSFTEEVDFPLGEPENPMSVEAVHDKFMDLALMSGRTQIEATAIYDTIMDAENSFSQMMSLIHRSGQHNRLPRNCYLDHIEQ